MTEERRFAEQVSASKQNNGALHHMGNRLRLSSCPERAKRRVMAQMALLLRQTRHGNVIAAASAQRAGWRQVAGETCVNQRHHGRSCYDNGTALGGRQVANAKNVMVTRRFRHHKALVANVAAKTHRHVCFAIAHGLQSYTFTLVKAVGGYDAVHQRRRTMLEAVARRNHTLTAYVAVLVF